MKFRSKTKLIEIRKTDYIVFIIHVIFNILNLAVPFKLWNVLSCFILALILSLI